MSAPTVAIFGSCVSRDLFEDARLRPSLGHYGARSSIISAVAAPVAIAPERVAISSEWQRRQVLADFGKTFFASLEQTRPDWLLIDLIDERFDVLCTSGSFVTRSSAFQAAGLDDATELGLQPIRRMSPDGRALFADAAPAFAQRVLELIPRERVVLHRALWCTRFLRGGTVHEFPEERRQLSELQNAMLTDGYDALEEAFGGAGATIDVDPQRHLADAHHRWELEPYHYAPAYNDYAAQELLRLTGATAVLA
ncbi:MAG TPA: DUF6270 domain-containing protein [Conexibacter sp.]|nr:DUF6270 domain-containing protein [Conexibacter sp.]